MLLDVIRRPTTSSTQSMGLVMSLSERRGSFRLNTSVSTSSSNENNRSTYHLERCTWVCCESSGENDGITRRSSAKTMPAEGTGKERMRDHSFIAFVALLTPSSVFSSILHETCLKSLQIDSLVFETELTRKGSIIVIPLHKQMSIIFLMNIVITTLCQ